MDQSPADREKQQHTELLELKYKLESAQRESTFKSAEIEGLRSTIQKLEEALQMSRDDVSHLKRRLDEQSEENRGMQQRIVDLNVKLTSERFIDAEKSLNDLNKMLIEELKHKIDHYRDRVTEAQREVQTLKQELSTKESKSHAETLGVLQTLSSNRNLIQRLTRENNVLRENSRDSEKKLRFLHQHMTGNPAEQPVEGGSPKSNANAGPANSEVEREYNRIIGLYESSFGSAREMHREESITSKDLTVSDFDVNSQNPNKNSKEAVPNSLFIASKNDWGNSTELMRSEKPSTCARTSAFSTLSLPRVRRKPIACTAFSESCGRFWVGANT